MVLTDHFVTGSTAVDRKLPWDQQMRRYYEAYLEACEEAKALDSDVLFGLEHHYGKGKEVLVYGIDLDFPLVNPDLDEIPLAVFAERVHDAGGVVVHAHPYRQRDYIDPGFEPRLELVDGIEVYNMGDDSADNDRKALAHSRTGDYLITCGSDLHIASALPVPFPRQKTGCRSQTIPWKSWLSDISGSHLAFHLFVKPI